MRYAPLEIEDAEAARLCKRVRAGDDSAFETLYAAVLPFIKSMARQFVKRSMPLDDLQQQLGIALRYEVVESFDGSKGTFGGFCRVCLERRAMSILKASWNPKRKRFSNAIGSYDVDEGSGAMVRTLKDAKANAPDARLEAKEDARALLAELSDLEAFVMRQRLKGSSYEDMIARLLKGVKGLEGYKRSEVDSLWKAVDNASERIKRKATDLIESAALERQSRRRKRKPLSAAATPRG